MRHVVYDTNWWKSFVHARLAVSMGDRGCLSLFGSKPESHRLFAEQVTAEYFVKTSGRGRTVDEWKLRPEQSDNHWLDCLVGSAVASACPNFSGAVGHERRILRIEKHSTRHRMSELQLPTLLCRLHAATKSEDCASQRMPELRQTDSDV